MDTRVLEGRRPSAIDRYLVRVTDFQGFFEASTLDTSANGLKFLEESSTLKRSTSFLVRILVSLCGVVLGFTTTSAAQQAPGDLANIYLPLVMESSSMTTGIVVHNMEAAEATVTLTAHDAGGNVSDGLVDTIAGNHSTTYSLSPILQGIDGEGGFDGAVTVSSSSAIAAVATIARSDGTDSASYGSQDQPSGILQLPMLANGNFGTSTVLAVYNPGTAAAHVSVDYSDCTSAKAILPAKGFHLFDQVREAHTQTIFSGTVSSAGVKLSGGASVVAVVMVRSQATLGVYAALASGSTEPVFPLVMANVFDTVTGIQLQNAGSSDTEVSLSYTSALGQGGHDCVETRTISAGGSETFALSAFRDGDSSDCRPGQAFRGSARVVANSRDNPLVGLATISKPDQNSGTYAALDPAEATGRVLMPVIMHNQIGESTLLSVVNLGFATTVHCTFSDSAYRSSTTLLTGEAFLELGPSEEGYLGSATCDAEDGASIAAVVSSFASSSSGSSLHLHRAFSTLPASTETNPPVSSGGLVGARR